MKPIELPDLVTMGTDAAWDLRSEDNAFRYAIGRSWDQEHNGTVLNVFAMNPSKARFDVNDPTLLKLVHFAKQEGCGGLLLRNVGAYSATDPRELGKVSDPIGPRNEEVLMLDAFGPRVAAWGNFTSHGVRRRLSPMVGVIKIYPGLLVFGVNGTGEPKHPLYLKNSTRLVNWADLTKSKEGGKADELAKHHKEWHAMNGPGVNGEGPLRAPREGQTWVDCKERMPEHYDLVQFQVAGWPHPDARFVGRWDGTSWRDDTDTDRDGVPEEYSAERVSHWRELAEPPSKPEGGK